MKSAMWRLAAWGAALGMVAGVLTAPRAVTVYADGVPPPTGCASITLPIPGNPNKVTLCHFTGSASNPFIINEVALSAATSHFSHHGDCIRFANGNTVCF